MDASLAGLVRAGKITMAVAEQRSSEPAEMRKLVHAENLQDHTHSASVAPVAA
jgi:hypothetical protein